MTQESYGFINQAEIRLSLNENPAGPQEIRPFSTFDWSDFKLNRYMRQEDGPLLPAISAYTGFPTDCIVAGNGGDEIIFNLVQALARDSRSILINPPTFGEYAAAAFASGVRVFEVKLDDDFEMDCGKIIETCNREQVDLVFICNPNNPTANLYSKEKILSILDGVSAYVVVDEAYYEFSGETMEAYLQQYPKMILLRTLSKAFAAAGLRVGYALANPEVAKKIRGIQMPFNISNVSLILGAELLRNKDYFLADVAAAQKERALLTERLNSIDGLEAYASYTNYLVVDVGAPAAEAVEFLKTNGISVRDISGMDPRLAQMIRVSIGLPEENSLLVRLLAQFKREIEDGTKQ